MPECQRESIHQAYLPCRGSLVPLPLQGAAPASLALSDAFHSPSARAGTEPLGWRSQLFGEPLVAAGTVATVVEKSSEWLPSPHPEVPLPVWFASGCGRARGIVGSARCVSLCQLPSPGISAGSSSASTFLLPRGTHGCNSDLLPAAGETAARILSADRDGSAAGVPVASVLRLASDVAAGVYNPRVGPWEVKALPEAPAPERTPLLSGATAGIRFSASSTLTARHASLVFPRCRCGYQTVAAHPSVRAHSLPSCSGNLAPPGAAILAPSLTATNRWG
jgi:hypothetical protein